jgi:hypothetical protein
MTSILILLALSTLSGFVLGRRYLTWHAILAAGAALAPLSAVVLQIQGFAALSGISTIVACLTVNQVAYLVGAICAPISREDLPHHEADDGPRDHRDKDIPHQHERQHNAPIHFAQVDDPHH